MLKQPKYGRLKSQKTTPRDSLLLFDGIRAGVAHAHWELEAHDGEGGALGAAFPANGLSTLPAVVLRRHGRGVKQG